MNAPVLANVFGVLGAVCWSIQLIPQILRNYRRGDTHGLQPTFMLIWALAGVPLSVYNIVLDFNIALKIQPFILTSLSLVTWIQCCYYGSRWSIRKCLTYAIAIVATMAGTETALILAIRRGIDNGHVWPATLMGILSGVMLCAGVACEYHSIWRYKTVEGISFLFCAIDAAGDVASIVSVVFEPTYDFYAIGIYAAEFGFWCGIFACGFYLKVLPLIGRSMTCITTQPERNAFELQTRAQTPVVTSQAANRSSISVFRTASGRSEEHQLPRHRLTAGLQNEPIH